MNKGESGRNVYKLDDGFNVFENVKGTPKYWRQVKNELIARLENFGPFVFFFTLSCADLRWPENFTSLLQDKKIIFLIEYGIEKVFVDSVPLDEFLKQNEKSSDFIKKNITTGTINFHHRVKQFMKCIVMNKSNPMHVKYHNYKTEFQMRGAAHIHGTLWVDWEEMLEDKELRHINIQSVKKTFKKIKNYEVLDKTELEELEAFADEFISCSLQSPTTRDIVNQVNVHHHTKSCKKYDTSCRFSFPKYPCLNTIISQPSKVFYNDENERKNKMDEYKFILQSVKTVIENDILVKEICAKDLDTVKERFELLKLKNLFTFFENGEPAKIKMFEYFPEIWIWTEEERFLNSEEITILQMSVDNNLSILEEKYLALRRKRLHTILECANFSPIDGHSLIETYETALAHSDVSYGIHYSRDLDELFVNHYNPEWIESWNANMDIQLCLDFYAVLTYISDYYGKDETGTTNFIKAALKDNPNDSLKEKFQRVANTFITHRELGVPEALYRLLPNLHLKESNTTCIFVQTGFKQNRSKFLKKLTEEEQNSNAVEVEDKDGLYVEKSSLLDKYQQRDTVINSTLKDLCYAQFCQRYVSCKTLPQKVNISESMQAQDCDIKLHNYIITYKSLDNSNIKLPAYIKLKGCALGESQYMKLRSPQCLRFHKINRMQFPHEYEYSQLLLYRPFMSEEELFPYDREKCLRLFNEESTNGMLKINKVKSLILEHLEDVEKSRALAAEDIDEHRIAENLDSMAIQENEDCEEEGSEIYEKNILSEFSDTKISRDNYRKIELYESGALKSMTDSCDKEQLLVIDKTVTYAKSIKKGDMSASPPLLVVTGGAGTGKSRTIDILCQHVERILRNEGDNPDQPYILKCAPTGTAAANIDGQTLHQIFKFSFGPEFRSLNDQQRDKLREQLKNLRILIIDEISMIGSDFLYKIVLRLKEISRHEDRHKPFGGKAVLCFGDFLQLKPVQARYIFQSPSSTNFKTSFLVSSLWQTFQSIELIENYRQGNLAIYTKTLNNIRIGKLEVEDLKLLNSRVRNKNDPEIPPDAMYISCTNAKVNLENEKKLALINEPLVSIVAKVNSYLKSDIKPQVTNTGNIRNTPLPLFLKMKKGAKIMLTYNLDVSDSLTNGACGEIIDFQFRDNVVDKVLIAFNNPKVGSLKRKEHMYLKSQYPDKNVTPIEKIEFHFSFSGKSDNSNSATAVQFPLKLAFAATSHKVQGLTVKTPTPLVIDLCSVLQPAQAYVMLSRVQEISQLFIVDAVPSNKMYAHVEALEEQNRLHTSRMTSFSGRTRSDVYLTSFNVYSLRKNITLLHLENQNMSSHIICLQETWLFPGCELASLEMKNMNLAVNSVGPDGRGKGIAAYLGRNYKENLNVTKKDFQMSSYLSQIDKTYVINIYRSSNADDDSFIDKLELLMNYHCDADYDTIICGDFNICVKSEKDHNICQYMRKKGFKQLVSNPTHDRGRVLDHIYVKGFIANMSVVHHSTTGSDHDMLHLVKM